MLLGTQGVFHTKVLRHDYFGHLRHQHFASDASLKNARR
jgi:hypothetical protein